MTITYTEKGIGQHQAVRTAGYSLEQRDGVWTSNNDVAVQAILDAYSLEQVKRDVVAQITDLAKRKFDAAIADISSGEMAGWPILKSEASAYIISNNEADCPSIVSEAYTRGITVPALVAKVVANSARFNGMRGYLSGLSGKHRDAVAALTTIEAVMSYDFNVGWPEL